MSEIIPSHIGSKLTDFSSIVVDETSASDWPQDEEQSGFQEKEEVNETDIALNTKQGNTMQKRKKAAPKATTKRKRTNGVKKSLPRNPGAGAATSEAVADLQLPPLDLEVLEEESPKDLISDEPTAIPEVPEVSEVAEDLPELILDNLDTGPDVASATPLKPPAKKTTTKRNRAASKPVAKRAKKVTPPPTNVVKAEPASIVKEPVKPESSLPVAKTVLQPVDNNAASVVAERRAFVARIKTETKAFLDQLAAERKQREQEYKQFRQSLQQDLGRK